MLLRLFLSGTRLSRLTLINCSTTGLTFLSSIANHSNSSITKKVALWCSVYSISTTSTGKEETEEDERKKDKERSRARERFFRSIAVENNKVLVRGPEVDQRRAQPKQWGTHPRSVPTKTEAFGYPSWVSKLDTFVEEIEGDDDEDYEVVERGGASDGQTLKGPFSAVVNSILISNQFNESVCSDGKSVQFISSIELS